MKLQLVVVRNFLSLKGTSSRGNGPWRSKNNTSKPAFFSLPLSLSRCTWEHLPMRACTRTGAHLRRCFCTSERAAEAVNLIDRGRRAEPNSKPSKINDLSSLGTYLIRRFVCKHGPLGEHRLLFHSFLYIGALFTFQSSLTKRRGLHGFFHTYVSLGLRVFFLLFVAQSNQLTWNKKKLFILNYELCFLILLFLTFIFILSV